MKAFILAAGQGTRLKYLTVRRPKPMLPLSNIPLLQHTIEWLRDYGVKEIAINVHHAPAAITNYFGNGNRFGVSIVYSQETQLLGTAGAVKEMEDFLDESFVVVYGDVYTNIDLKRLGHHHQQHVAEATCAVFGQPATLTMALYEVDKPEEKGVVETDGTGRVTRFVEKPLRHEIFTHQAFSGVMMCDPNMLEYIPAGVAYDFGNEVMPQMLKAGIPIYAEPIAENEFVIDIGTLGGYLLALKTAAQRRVGTRL